MRTTEPLVIDGLFPALRKGTAAAAVVVSSLASTHLKWEENPLTEAIETGDESLIAEAVAAGGDYRGQFAYAAGRLVAHRGRDPVGALVRGHRLPGGEQVGHPLQGLAGQRVRVLEDHHHRRLAAGDVVGQGLDLGARSSRPAQSSSNARRPWRTATAWATAVLPVPGSPLRAAQLRAAKLAASAQPCRQSELPPTRPGSCRSVWHAVDRAADWFFTRNTPPARVEPLYTGRYSSRATSPDGRPATTVTGRGEPAMSFVWVMSAARSVTSSRASVV